jgi:hypothetical protein
MGCGKTWLLRRLLRNYGSKEIRKIELPVATFRALLLTLDPDRSWKGALQSKYREMIYPDSCEILESQEEAVIAAGVAQTFSSTH